MGAATALRRIPKSARLRSRACVARSVSSSGRAAHLSRRRRARVLLFLLVAVAAASPAAAQIAVPVRLEGYWERSHETHPDILGDLTLAARRGTATRVFGATQVQTHFRAGGIYMFTRTLRPVFTVTGEKEMVDRFFAAPPERKAIVTAMYREDIGTLALTSVEIEGDDR